MNVAGSPSASPSAIDEALFISARVRVIGIAKSRINSMQQIMASIRCIINKKPHDLKPAAKGLPNISANLLLLL